MKGQSAIEYVIILGAAMMVLGSVTVYQLVNPSSDASEMGLRRARAESACNAIASAIDSVYANGPGAVKSVVVSLPPLKKLEILRNPPRLVIQFEIYGGVENTEANIKYGFDSSISDVPSGSYAVVVEWSEEGLEGIDSRGLENGKIYIYINPGGEGG